MSEIFIYRRGDSRDVTERVYERLSHSFGKNRVFKDVDNIPAGADFREELRRSLNGCKVLLVVMGPNWLGQRTPDALPRIFEAGDYVRLEIEEAMAKGIPVVPVLVSGGQLPQSHDLPEKLHKLQFHQAALVRHDPDFSIDAQRLVRAIEQLGIRRKWPYRWVAAAVAAIIALILALSLTLVAFLVPYWAQQQRAVLQAQDSLDLIDLVTSSISPGAWNGLGGFSIKESHGALSIYATDKVHLEVQDLLEQLRASRGLPSVKVTRTDSLEKRALYKLLEEPSSLEVVETPVADLASYLAALYEIRVTVDSQALLDAGTSMDVPMTINAKGAPLHAALSHVLADQGLTYMCTDLGLVITTFEKANSVRAARVFDVRQLLGN